MMHAQGVAFHRDETPSETLCNAGCRRMPKKKGTATCACAASADRLLLLLMKEIKIKKEFKKSKGRLLV
jgi:hypothetical protein